MSIHRCAHCGCCLCQLEVDVNGELCGKCQKEQEERYTEYTVNPVKFRMHSWYWGNYCYQIENGVWMDNNGKIIGDSNYFNQKDLEEYVEELHGWHLSEEYKNAK